MKEIYNSVMCHFLHRSTKKHLAKVWITSKMLAWLVCLMFTVHSFSLKAQYSTIYPEVISRNITDCELQLDQQIVIENTGVKDIIYSAELNITSPSIYDELDQFDVSSYGVSGMTVAGDFMYVLYFSGKLQKFDLIQKKFIHQIDLGFEPYGLDYDGRYLWVGDYDGRISNYDLFLHKVGSSILMPYEGSGSFTYNGSGFYVASNTGINDIYKIDMDGKVLDTVFYSVYPIYGLQYVEEHGEDVIWFCSDNNNLSKGTIVDKTLILESSAFYSDLESNIAHNGVDLVLSGKYGPAYIVHDGIWEDNTINLTDTSGVISSGNSANLHLTFNAGKLLTGTYSGTITIKSNDILNPVRIIPVNFTYSGSSVIDLSESSLNYVNIPRGLEVTKTVTVTNVGCSTLEVDDIVNNLSDYTISPTSFSLDKGASQAIQVTFTPSSTGIFNDTLVLSSNTGASTDIYLYGKAVEPPVMAVAVDTLRDTLSSCFGSTTKAVKISNTGTTNLNLNLAVDDSITIELYSGEYGEEVSWEIVDEEGTVYASGGPYVSDADYTHTIYLPTGDYSFKSYDAYGDGWNGGYCYLYLRDQPILYNSMTDSNEKSVDFQVENFAITVSETNLTIPPSSESIVYITANSNDFSVGEYYGRVLINANDPIKSKDSIYYELTVEGEANIELISNTIEFENVFVNQDVSQSIMLYNIGCDDLVIGSINNSLPEYNVGASTGMVTPFDSTEIQVDFSSAVVGSFIDTIVISSNIENDTIFLSAVVVEAPELLVSTDTILDTQILCSSSSVKTFTISNPGVSDLDYNIFLDNLGETYKTKTLSYFESGETLYYSFDYTEIDYSNLTINIRLYGDYTDVETEYAELMIEGVSYGLINTEDIPEGYSYSRTFNFSGAEVLNWLTDGQIEIAVVNSDEVDPEAIGSNEIQIELITGRDDIIQVSPMSGTLASGASDEISVTFDANNKLANSYSQKIFIVSNDPVNETDTIYYEMDFQGSMEIILSSNSFAFDDVPESSVASQTLMIRNDGCDTLKLTHITGATSEIYTDITSFELYGHDSIAVTIYFDPTTVTSYSTNLIFYNGSINLFDVDVSGTAVNDPAFSLSTSVIDEDITVCESIQTATYDISNTGTGNLNFENIPDGIYNNTLSDTYSTAGEMNGYSFTGMNPESQTLSATITLNGDYNSYTSEYALLYIEGVFYDTINTVNTPIGQDFVKDYVFDIDDFSDWIADGILSMAIENSSFVEPGFGTQLNQIEVSAFEFDYVTVVPQTGTILPGESTTVTVSFNSAGLSVDTYTGNITVNSNDPANLTNFVSYDFNYIGTPEIGLSQLAFDFGEVSSHIKRDTLWIINEGCDTLSITNITGTTTEYSVDRTTFDIFPHSEEPVVVQLASTTIGEYSTTLTILSNVGNETVDLIGKIIESPDIEIDVTSITKVISECGDTTYQTVTVSNIGGSDLNVSIDPNTGNWLHVSQTELVIPTGESTTFDVIFYTENILVGSYFEILNLVSNDPYNFNIGISCDLTYSGTPTLVYEGDDLVFPSVFVNDVAYANILVENTGCDTLKITSVACDNSDFTGTAASVEIPSGESTNVLVAYSPSTEDDDMGILTITTNGGNAIIVCSGTGALPKVMGVSSLTNDGSYNVGNVINLAVNFNNNVIVNTTGGTPMIALNTTPVSYAYYTSGTGTRELEFEYTVGATDEAVDLDYTSVNALTLESGIILDVDGNTPDLTLPTVGAFASDHQIVIDNTNPTGTLSLISASPTASNPIVISIVFDEPVIGFEKRDFVVGNGYATNLVGDGIGMSFNLYIMAEGDGTVTVDLPENSLRDFAGNGNNVATQLTAEFNGSLPLISFSSKESDPTSASPILVDITSNVLVSGLELADFVVINGTAANLIEVTTGEKWTIEIIPTTTGNVEISVPGNTYQNATSDWNPDESAFVIYYDATPPSIEFSSPSTNPTNDKLIIIDMQFSEKVTGFDESDLTVFNGTIQFFGSSYDMLNWSISVIPGVDGNVRITVPAGSVFDGVGNSNEENVYSIYYDIKEPAGVLSSESELITNDNPMVIDVVFDEKVNGLTFSDFIVDNGVSTGLTVVKDYLSWKLDVKPTNDGVVSVYIKGQAVADLMGYANKVSNILTRTYDGTLPLVQLVTVNDTLVEGPINLDISFSEPVSGFAIDDISLSNASASDLVMGADSLHWSVTVIPDTVGIVTITIPDSAVFDIANNGNELTTIDVLFDDVAPQVVISALDTGVTNKNPILLTIDFGENVSGFELNDIVVSNGAASNLKERTGTAIYTAEVVPGDNGEVSVSIANSIAVDVVGNKNIGASFSIIYDGVIPVVTEIAIGARTSSSAVAGITANKEGIIYYVLQLQRETAPTASEILAGSGSSATAAIASGNSAVTANVAKSISFTDLTENTAYAIYVVAEDELKMVSVVAETEFFTTRVGINMNEDLSVKIYPNPTTSYVNVSLGDDTHDYQYHIYSVKGDMLSQGQILHGQAKIDLSEFTEGIYTIGIVIDDQIKNFTVVKE